MSLWRTAIRTSPIAVAALSLTKVGDRRRDGDKDGRFSAVLSEANYSQRNVTPALGKAKDQTGKGLLGRSHWVYRLVCSVDIHEVYELEKEIGSGGFATVYLGRHKYMGYHRAVKKIHTGHNAITHDDLMEEVSALMDLDHPHIIKLARTYDAGDNLYIVSELCNGPSLFDRILKGPMSDHEIGVALRHMLKAVRCCHSRYKGHYDIKPDNFMYSDVDCKKLKMIDLGLSSSFKRADDELKGTVIYMAPEIFFGMYGPEADLWSCGVVLFMMTTRQSLLPIDASDEKVISLLRDRNWLKERLRWASERVSEECFDLLNQMLCYDRHMRITAADALKHPFVDRTYYIDYSRKKRKDNREEKAAMRVISSMADSFVDFGNEPVLVRVALVLMLHIAGYYGKETKTHRLAYSMLDRVGVGELSLDSIEAMMPKYGLAIPENLGAGFKAVDLNCDGYLTYGSFLSATMPLNLRCREDVCRRAFSLLDKNQDGLIDLQDLLDAFQSKEEKQEKQDTELRNLCFDAITEVSEGRSHIDFDRFLNLMLKGNSPIAAGAEPGMLTS